MHLIFLWTNCKILGLVMCWAVFSDIFYKGVYQYLRINVSNIKPVTCGWGGTQVQARELMGKVTYRAETTPLPLLEQRPAEQSDGSRATRCWILQTVKGVGVTCQDTPWLRRTSASWRYTGNVFTPTLEITLTSKFGTMKRGKGDIVTSQSCHHSVTTCQVGRLGRSLLWHW